MPFDGQSDPSPTIALARFREQPTLRDLAVILRHREVWPEGFEWRFSQCEHCALGVAAALLQESPEELLYFKWASDVFGISFYRVEELFHKAPRDAAGRFGAGVTHEHVAAAIEKYLATTA
jgi:hypothetical protein